MLEGKTVRLRALDMTDLDRLCTWINDVEVTRYLGATRYQMTRQEEERWLSNQPPPGVAGGVRFAIETKEGVHIGNVDLHPGNVEDRKASLGIMIGDKEYWSNGYGTDAIVTLLRFAFHEMGLHRVWLTTLDFNQRAIACYLKCGFRHEGRLRQDVFRHGRYRDFVLMGILRDEVEEQARGAR